MDKKKQIVIAKLRKEWENFETCAEYSDYEMHCG